MQVDGDSVDADHCVVAAPLPPLRALDFVPALPSALAEAIASLQYVIGTKTLVQYDSRVWRKQGFDGDTFTDLPISTTWEATDGQPGRAGVLLVYTMGKPGFSFSDMVSDGSNSRQSPMPPSSPLSPAAQRSNSAEAPTPRGVSRRQPRLSRLGGAPSSPARPPLMR